MCRLVSLTLQKVMHHHFRGVVVLGIFFYISGMFGLLVVSSRISVFLETFTNICSSLKASQALLSCQVGYLCSQLLWSERDKYFIHASEVFMERGVAINNRLDVKKGTQSFSLPFARTSLRLTREENYFIFAWNEKQYMLLLKIMISMSVQVGSFFFFFLPMSLSKLILTVHIVAAKLSRKERGLRLWVVGRRERGGKIHLPCGRYWIV